MNSENKNDLLGFDLDEIFEEESKKAPRFFTDESSLNAERNIYLQKRLSEKLIHEFETKFSIDAGNIMFGILSRLSQEQGVVLHYSIMHNIFNEAINIFEEKHKKWIEQNPHDHLTKYGRIIGDIKFFAELYFTRQVEKEMKGKDLPEKLKNIKRTLATNNNLSFSEPFLHKALIKCLKETEQEIALKKEEATHRQHLEIYETKETNTAENRIVEGDLRQKTFTLLLLLFGHLEIPPAKENLRTQIIDYVSFCTGQTRQNVKTLLQKPTKYAEGSKLSRDKIIFDLRIARDHLRSLGKLLLADILTSEANAILDIESEELEIIQEKKSKKKKIER